MKNVSNNIWTIEKIHRQLELAKPELAAKYKAAFEYATSSPDKISDNEEAQMVAIDIMSACHRGSEAFDSLDFEDLRDYLTDIDLDFEEVLV